MGHPTIHPTGVTLYNKDKAFSGYTLYQAHGVGAILIDLNGTEVKIWRDLDGFPNKLLPGGQVFGSTGRRNPKYALQDQVDLVQVDWDGNIVWKFDKNELVEDPGDEPRYVARQHHDYQREGNPVGYFVPNYIPQVSSGKTLVLTHENVKNEKISDKELFDDKIIEIDYEGNILWSWRPNEHFDELEFSDIAKEVIYKDPNLRPIGAGIGDWLHINSASYLGPNKWYDSGDERFHPDNIIWDAREANIIGITSKETGKIVWQLGPEYDKNEKLKKIGWIIGQHHAHLIPRGLPGEGNILVYDNGGWGGYGVASPNSPSGRLNVLRDYSRVLEIDPVNLEIVWQYTPKEAGLVTPLDSSRFYSPFISGAQRLPNGNTLITEGSNGRVFEVTANHELVWEFINPYKKDDGGLPGMNIVYRAYRYPYDWVPQLETPVETSIEKVDISTFRVPGASPLGAKNEVTIKSSKKYKQEGDFCVISSND